MAGEFKSPGGGGGNNAPPESPGNVKKKRRTSSAASASSSQAQSSPSLPELVPPPLSGYGDTIVASNPFDDTPIHHPVQNSMAGHYHQMQHHHQMGPGGPPPQGMGPMQMPPNMNHMGGMPPMNSMANMNSMPGAMNHSMNGMPPMSMGGGGMFPGPGMGPKPMPVSTGKVYPPDQPMVFNPQNPNAPPIYPCGICHKEVHDNDQAILCESGCNFWFHRICTGLTEAAYHLLTQEVYAEWVCDKCLSAKEIPLVKFKP